MKIYVAGHTGLVGSAIVREIESVGKHSWFGKSRQQLDLLDRKSVFEYVASTKPDAIVIAAAKVGGINANSKYPVEFLSQNLQIEANLIDAAAAADIAKVLFLGSSCIYPKLSPQPIKEEYLLTGELEPTNEAYAIAKIAGLKLIGAYRSEYSKDWISAMPTNMYGPGDNFDLDNAHVLPALIRRFHEAKVSNSKSVTLWGTGSPMREFLHADDLAAACIFLLEEYSGDVPVNVGTGSDISIKVLAEKISRVVGFKGEIKWDSSKPDGTPRKLLDVSRINSLGWSAKITLETGLQTTYDWFLSNEA
jgi:GDP-L-fucose synthase